MFDMGGPAHDAFGQDDLVHRLADRGEGSMIWSTRLLRSMRTDSSKLLGLLTVTIFVISTDVLTRLRCFRAPSLAFRLDLI